MKLKLSEIEAADIELYEAIYLFYDNAHPIIIETLIGAVIGILRGVAKKQGIQAPFHDSDLIKPEYKKEWIKHIHKAQNFCKHADQDSEDILDYETEMLPFQIYEACHLFRYLSSNNYLKYRQSNSAITFELWFGLKYPYLLKDKNEFDEFLRLVGMPRSFTVDNYKILKTISAQNRIKRVFP